MSVLDFRSSRWADGGPWTAREMTVLRGVAEAFVASGEATGWDVGATERGDPQFYLLAAPPLPDCRLVVSRVGRRFVLEDGQGLVLAEADRMEAVADRALALAGRPRRVGFGARLLLLLVAVQAAVEEKLEPILVETEELALRLGPQLASLA